MPDFKTNDIVKFTVKGQEYYGKVEKVTPTKLTVSDLEDYETHVLSKEKATRLEPVLLDEETYKKFAQYEITVQDIIKDNVVERIVNKDNYVITLEDIFCVIKKLIGEMHDKERFINEWFCYFYDVLVNTEYRGVDNSFYNRNILLGEVLQALMDYAFFDFDFGFDKEYTELQHFFEDERKPLINRRYPRYAKINLLLQLENENSLNCASEEEVALYKKFALELCEVGDERGLLAVGYGSYGGNRVFACDWKKSEECMLKLIETVDDMPDKAFYANTLGYIYYYGRCNNGIPEYEKAYHYFSFAAFNRVYEAEYKIADMYQHGYSVPKSTETARSIISRLYNENLEYIQNGQFDCKFADIAFRMGNLCKVRENLYYPDIDTMLIYYYQASFAIRMRMLESDYYGDRKVADAIETALRDTKEIMNFKHSDKVRRLSISSILYDHLSKGNALDVKAKMLSSGKCKLTIQPHKKWQERYPKRLFITIPELDMCGLYDSITVTVIPCGENEIFCPDKMFTIDSIEGNVFSFDGFPMLFCEDCLFEIKKPKNDSQKHRFVSVQFTPGGKSYDYLCDDTSIKVGDNITLSANGEEKEVPVVNVFEKTESETKLPIKAYKRI